jgi:anti-anti-sigma regulatory factor
VSEQVATTTPGRPVAGDELLLTVVDDPEGHIQLVGARGVIDTATVSNVIEVLDELDDGRGLHLDLSAATLRGSNTIHRLERMIDELERRGVGLRIVGVDPKHPALVPPSSR